MAGNSPVAPLSLKADRDKLSCAQLLSGKVEFHPKWL